jgi:hypothetical protein
MKVTAILPFVAVVSALAISSQPPPVPDVQILPSSTRKDSVIKRVRYGPHTLKKAEVSILILCETRTHDIFTGYSCRAQRSQNNDTHAISPEALH